MPVLDFSMNPNRCLRATDGTRYVRVSARHSGEADDARGGETTMMIRHLNDPIRTEVAFLGAPFGA